MIVIICYCLDQEFVTTNTPADSILTTTTMAATTLTSESGIVILKCGYCMSEV